MTNEIKINKKGKILEGDNKHWFVIIKEDFENTGGYLILISKNLEFKGNDGSDYWVENYNSLRAFFDESNWKIEW